MAKSSDSFINHSPDRVSHDSASPARHNSVSGETSLLQGMPPRRILLLLVVSSFLCEIIIMFILHLWPTLPLLPEALFDASILTLILFPTFYFLHYRPMVENFRQRDLVMDQLVSSEERLKLALQAVNDGLWDWDIQTGAVYYSPQCATMLGYPPEELKPDFDSLALLIHPEDRDRFERQISENIGGQMNEISIELRLKCREKGHAWLWVLVRGKVVKRGADGSPLRAVGTNKNIHDRKLAEAALQQKEAQIHNLSRQLVKTTEAEKKHLAQELHDDFGQMITAFKLGVEMIRDQGCNQPQNLGFHCSRLLEIGTRMERSLEEICDDLRPAMLDDLGLPKTLEWLIKQFSEQHAGIDTRIELTEFNMRLPGEVELTCYRICQEALHNISKHAHPTSVAVELDVCADKVELNISDNGRGFDPARRKSNSHWGLGLLGIHERAAAIGGVAAIESAVGKGTRVSVTLPRDPKE